MTVKVQIYGTTTEAKLINGKWYVKCLGHCKNELGEELWMETEMDLTVGEVSFR